MQFTFSLFTQAVKIEKKVWKNSVEKLGGSDQVNNFPNLEGCPNFIEDFSAEPSVLDETWLRQQVQLIVEAHVVAARTEICLTFCQKIDGDYLLKKFRHSHRGGQVVWPFIIDLDLWLCYAVHLNE